MFFLSQELINFLRQCPEQNTLTLYRDASRSQTPLTPENSQFEAIIAHNSLPKPSFLLKRNSQSPSRKNLRYEAAELVRSLQSSRTSLEKAGLGSHPGSYSGSGTLGRRLGRPYSPGIKDKNLLMSPANPVPTVESPVSPHNNSAPASLIDGSPLVLNSRLTNALQKLKIEQSLCIEEVDSFSPSESHQYSPEIEEVISATQSPNKEFQNLSFRSHKSNSLQRGSSNHYLISPGKSEGDSTILNARINSS